MDIMVTKIMSVDLQKEFSAPGGKHYRLHSNVNFIRDTFIPFLRIKDVKIAEIISDYRQPRPGDLDDSTKPGEWGYESELPNDIKLNPVWIKCMNSPIWTRKNIGNPNKRPGLPYQDPKGFGSWLSKVVGEPSKGKKIVLIGLTLDCCVFCTAQELTFRGYDVKILAEGVDVYSGKKAEKKQILNNYPLSNWAEPVSWKELKPELGW
jgi:nicotinamidase-related amidase